MSVSHESGMASIGIRVCVCEIHKVAGNRDVGTWRVVEICCCPRQSAICCRYMCKILHVHIAHTCKISHQIGMELSNILIVRGYLLERHLLTQKAACFEGRPKTFGSFDRAAMQKCFILAEFATKPYKIVCSQKLFWGAGGASAVVRCPLWRTRSRAVVGLSEAPRRLRVFLECLRIHKEPSCSRVPPLC